MNLTFRSSLMALVILGLWGCSKPADEESAENAPLRSRVKAHVQAKTAASGKSRTRGEKIGTELGLPASLKNVVGANGEVIDEKDMDKLMREVNEQLQKYLSQMSEDQKKVLAMRRLMSSGDVKATLRAARDLMDSKDPTVRFDVAQTLGWIGTPALSELTEMLADPNPSVYEEALDQWHAAIDSMPDDGDKAVLLEELIPSLTEREEIDFALMSATRMRQEAGLEMVSEVIEANKGKLAEECALEMWDHMTGNADYENAGSVSKFITEQRQEQQELGELWTKIATALADGNEALARELAGLPPADAAEAADPAGGGGEGVPQQHVQP